MNFENFLHNISASSEDTARKVKEALIECRASKTQDEFVKKLKAFGFLTKIEEQFDRSFDSKCDQKAFEARKQGNHFFALKNFQQAHFFYTKAIKCATIPRESSKLNNIIFLFSFHDLFGI